MRYLLHIYYAAPGRIVVFAIKPGSTWRAAAITRFPGALMTGHEPFDWLPLWALFGATVALILLVVEAGFRVGRWRQRRAEHEREAPVGAIVAAGLGLLAFLLAFTFGMAASRFDTRRGLVLDEANAIGTTYLRAALLPEPHRTEIRTLLRDYVDLRLEAVQPGMSVPARERSEELQSRLCAKSGFGAGLRPWPTALPYRPMVGSCFVVNCRSIRTYR